MFCGSEGLFGIALEVTLRLVPLAEATRTALAVYDSLEAAGDAVADDRARRACCRSRWRSWTRWPSRRRRRAVKPGYPEGAALLIVELEGEREVVDADAARLADAAARVGRDEICRRPRTPVERALIWKGRKSAFSAVGWLAPDYIVQDGVVPRTRLGEALAEIGRMSAATGIRVANVFHAGDGNLHPLILFDGARAGRARARPRRWRRTSCACASRSAARSPASTASGVEKRAYLPLMFTEDDLALMRRLRDAVDPGGLANRGKMLAPRARARAGVTLAVDSVEAVQEAVRAGPRVLPVGGGTKPALSTPPADDVVALDLSSPARHGRVRPGRAHAHRAGRHAGRRARRGAGRATASTCPSTRR